MKRPRRVPSVLGTLFGAAGLVFSVVGLVRGHPSWDYVGFCVALVMISLACDVIAGSFRKVT